MEELFSKKYDIYKPMSGLKIICKLLTGLNFLTYTLFLGQDKKRQTKSFLVRSGTSFLYLQLTTNTESNG